MNIIIFKTSVNCLSDLEYISPILNAVLGIGNWSFALEDSEKIFRVNAKSLAAKQISKLLTDQGFLCEELPYSLDEFKI